MKANLGSVLVLLLVALVAMPLGSVHALAPYVGLYGDTIGGSGGANHSKWFHLVTVPYTELEVWVWFLPNSSVGMSAGEFKLTYPASADVIRGPVTPNPLNSIVIGNPYDGTSFTVTSCQYSWYWSHKQTLIVRTVAPTPLTVSIIGNPSNGGHIYVGDCSPGFPVKDATVLNHFGINHCFQPSHCTSPRLSNVAVKGYGRINAFFEYQAWIACAPTDYHDYFTLSSTSVPPDTIPILSATPVNYVEEFTLTLGEPLVDGTTYVLEARDVYNCECHHCFFYRDSQWQFTFDASVGTSESSWGAIKSLYGE